jgi:hypothetical protein
MAFTHPWVTRARDAANGALICSFYLIAVLLRSQLAQLREIHSSTPCDGAYQEEEPLAGGARAPLTEPVSCVSKRFVATAK